MSLITTSYYSKFIPWMPEKSVPHDSLILSVHLRFVFISVMDGPGAGLDCCGWRHSHQLMGFSSHPRR
ncbi:hypothetical protein J6590_071876 [Homalodisca vitripennis]|nr:hypothetical protein J6590_071876 [Homalodisca vitripennis]